LTFKKSKMNDQEYLAKGAALLSRRVVVR